MYNIIYATALVSCTFSNVSSIIKKSNLLAFHLVDQSNINGILCVDIIQQRIVNLEKYLLDNNSTNANNDYIKQHIRIYKYLLNQFGDKTSRNACNIISNIYQHRIKDIKTKLESIQFIAPCVIHAAKRQCIKFSNCNTKIINNINMLVFIVLILLLLCWLLVYITFILHKNETS